MVGDSLICTGRNDLPQAGGGQQSEVIMADYELIATDGDGTSSGRRRREAVALRNEREDVAKDFLVRLLSSSEWITALAALFPGSRELTEGERAGLVEETLNMGFVGDSRIFDLIEFNPSVHAEMSAVTTAARMGFSIADGLLYTTTFPCHECTRHIISTGIRQVVYLEPYAKSRAGDLFADQIRLSRPDGNQIAESTPPPVDYLPFMGIGPRRHAELFYWRERETESGTLVEYTLNHRAKLRPSIEAPVSKDLSAARWRARLKEQKLFLSDLDGRLERGKVQSRAAQRATRVPKID